MNTPLTLVQTPTVRAIARQQGIDLALLIEILQQRRPDKSDTENEFVENYLDPIGGMQRDTFGNRYLIIGEKPKVMWSCHTDTVSSADGRQNVTWDGDTLKVHNPVQGQTLGADDGAGLWLMLEMIKAQRPGLYLFHRAEEVGGLGSKWVAANNAELVDGIDMAIAFDRKATHSVITYQRGDRCCSDKFGEALAEKLNQTDGLKFKLDDGGVFTDTASYTKLISECTNLSAGYYDEHTSRERLDVAHLFRLREALLSLDVSDLPIERDKTKVESKWSYGNYGGGYGGYYGRTTFRRTGDKQLDAVVQLVEDYPITIGRILRGMGIDSDMLEQLIVRAKDATPAKTAKSVADVFFGSDEDLAGEDPQEDEEPDVEEQNVLWCRDCDSFTTEDDMDRWGSESCSWCRSNNVEETQMDVNLVTGEVVDA